MGTPNRLQRRTPNSAAYMVALAGVVTLLVLLCCYFLYFCIKRVKELSHQLDLESPKRAVKPTPSPAPAYPVHSVVREGATAMARLVTNMPTTNTSAVTKDTIGTRNAKVTTIAEVVSAAGVPTASISSPGTTSTEAEVEATDTFNKDQDYAISKDASLVKSLH